MPKPLNCPACAAPLEVDDAAGAMIRCPYCGNTLVLLAEARGDAGWQVPFGGGISTDQAMKLREVARLIRGGNKIAAIKLFRETFGVGLKEAKDAVDNLEAGHPVTLTHFAVRPGTPSIHINPQQAAAFEKAGKGALMWGAAVVIVLGIGVSLFAIFGGMAYFFSSRPQADAPSKPVVPTPPISLPSMPKQPAKPSFANVVMSFGSEGVGAGQFKDARSVAVDGEGRIYVGEYTGGRIQVFDADGKFISQWMVEPNTAVLDLAADRRGTVYVVHSGAVLRFDGATGRPLGQLPKFNPNRQEFTTALRSG